MLPVYVLGASGMTRSTISLRVELRDTLILAWPIVLNQVGHMSMGMVDTLVAGRISTTALAGLGLAANFFWTFTSVCAGCLLALDTCFSQAVGAGDDERLARYLEQSLWTCGLVTIISGVGIVGGAALYSRLAPASGMREAFTLYLQTIIWCLPSLFLFFVLQRYWQARQQVLPVTMIIIGANVLNFVACFALGLGRWGCPRLGVQGVALATVICR
jgi:MATE family multidrug resistance protein